MTDTAAAPDGRHHHYRRTPGGAKILAWAGNGEPHPDAYVAAGDVLTLAGIQGHHPAIHRAIRTALVGYCQDRAFPIARIEGRRVFPAHAVQGWLDDGGRAFIGERLAAMPAHASGAVVPFRRPARPAPVAPDDGGPDGAA